MGDKTKEKKAADMALIEAGLKMAGSKAPEKPKQRTRSVKSAPEKGNLGDFENKIKTKTVKTPGGRDFTYETNKDIEEADKATEEAQKKYFKKGGSVKCKRDGCAVRGKTKGKLC